MTLGYVPLDGSPESTYGRPIVVSGRLPDADRADEVAVNEELAARAGLRLGSRLPVGVYGSDQFGLVGNGAPLVPGGVHRSLRVVGVVRYPPDVLPTVLERNDFASDHSVMWLTPAFGAAMGADVANYGVGVMVRLRPGPVDLPHLQRAVAGVVGSDQVDVRAQRARRASTSAPWPTSARPPTSRRWPSSGSPPSPPSPPRCCSGRPSGASSRWRAPSPRRWPRWA